MDIGAFSALDREAQFAEAGRIAGVEPSVFDGIWRTESARGVYMRSPAGAEGHFGLMPKTRATMEGRFGSAIDPHDFGQALFTAAHLLKENMGRFRNLPDALRAYNGGWNPTTWGNKETAAYAGLVLGQDDEPATNYDASTAAALSPVAARAAETMWDDPFHRSRRTPKAAPSAISKATAALMDVGGASPPPDSNRFDIYKASTTAIASTQLAVEQEQKDTSFLDTARASAFNSAPVALLQLINRDPEPADPSWSVTEEQLKGFSADEQHDLANANSQRQYDRIKFDIEYGREQDRITFTNGTAFGLAASFLSMAPEAMVTGGIASLAFRGAGAGSYQLARAGRYGAAMASATAEGAVGNLINTAALDMLGKRQGVSAYAIGAAAGLLNPMLQGRYLGRVADRALEAAHAERLMVEAAENEARIMATAQSRLPADATPDQLRAEMNRVEAEGIRADIASHKAAIPESRKLNLGNEGELLDDAAEVAAKEVPVNALPETSNLKPAWEDPEFQQRRIIAAETRDDWKAQIETVLNGRIKADGIRDLPNGVTLTEEAANSVSLRAPINDIGELAQKYLPGSKIVIGTGNTTPGASGVVMSFGKTHVIGLTDGKLPLDSAHTAWHELGHAIYHQHAPDAPAALMARIDADYMAFAARAKLGDKAAWESRWAVTSPTARSGNTDIPVAGYTLSRDEWMAEQYVKHLQAAAMAGKLGGKLSPKLIDRITTAVRNVLEYVRSLVDQGYIKTADSADEFFHQILEGGFKKTAAADEFLAPELRLPSMEEAFSASVDMPDALVKEVNDFLNDPVAKRNGLDLMPLSTPAERAEAKSILALYKKAESPEYAVDSKRLSTLLDKVDALNPTSNTMLRSKNPVARMLAIELLENGGGAAGRRSTASIAKHMNERAIVGNSIVDLDREFKGWFKWQDGNGLNEALTGRKRAEFSRLVAEEIEQRRFPGRNVDLGPNVRAAADSMEGAFERARMMQVDAKTAGWAALPESSKGYMPHRIKSNVYRELTMLQKRALHQELTDQFITVSQFDPTFADQLASKYLDRVEHRALGGFDAPVGVHQTGAPDMIREALEQMGMNRTEIDAMMKRHVAGAAAHTKKRLNIDISKTVRLEDGTDFRLMDVYDTDMLSLLRGQAQRVSGEVALARHGVYGKPGLALARRAMGYGGDGAKATAREVGAFDQVSAEFLGQPFGEVNKWVDRATQFNSVSSLGGMGFNQLGEQINVGATLGVKAALSNVAEFGRLRSEVAKLARGSRVDNGLLGSIETMGGAEFGTDAFKMVFPLDNPDLFANSLGPDSLSAADRLLRGAGHMQAKLSLWRTIHSVQTRGVAEQIVLKAAKALREGAGDFHLRDMGIDDDVLNRLRADINKIVRTKDGKVSAFDITQAADKEAAHAFIQGVHRGASQIIQGTFIGESGRYVHSSWLRMLTQFRNFSLTAIDKQWNRQVGNRGITGAVVVTLAAMSVAAPIYMARTALASIGRADQQEYLDRHLSFGSIARATTNYIATAGLAGDFLDAATALTGTGELTGGRSGTATTAVGNLIAPAAGKVDKLWGAVQNTKDGTDPHALIRELPLSRLPFFIPAINALGD